MGRFTNYGTFNNVEKSSEEPVAQMAKAVAEETNKFIDCTPVKRDGVPAIDADCLNYFLHSMSHYGTGLSNENEVWQLIFSNYGTFNNVEKSSEEPVAQMAKAVAEETNKFIDCTPVKRDGVPEIYADYFQWLLGSMSHYNTFRSNEKEARQLIQFFFNLNLSGRKEIPGVAGIHLGEKNNINEKVINSFIGYCLDIKRKECLPSRTQLDSNLQALMTNAGDVVSSGQIQLLKKSGLALAKRKEGIKLVLDHLIKSAKEFHIEEKKSPAKVNGDTPELKSDRVCELDKNSFKP